MASILIGAAIVVLCACGFLGWKLLHEGPIVDAKLEKAAQEHADVERDRRMDELRVQARGTAESVAVMLTSIDSSTIDDGLAKVLDASTGDLKKEFTQASIQLRQLLVDNHAVASGKVITSAVQFSSLDKPEKVVVLLAVDQSITNDQVRAPRVDKVRFKMTMELVEGRWLASKLQYV
ncbi:Mce protein [Mycobacterium sp. CBMA271]|uniref:Mce protein n=1 Tax=Mycobacteroides sp. CBMA 326 TaxID=1904945 RepID=UPI0012DBD014|nr:Mce protein [Mycobacteroides sp. CBMA 326]MUM22672.1 Mce protein [Mycobacteroides sp. CBMA 271]